MNKLIAALVVLVALAVPAGASAQHYVLRHPKREHCRAHYVKKVETVKHRRETVCVHVAPKPQSAPAPLPAPAPATPPSTVTPAPSVKRLNAPYATEVRDSLETTPAEGDLIWVIVANVFALEEPVAGYPATTWLTTASLQYRITDTTTGVVEADPTIPTGKGCSILLSFESPSVTYSGSGAAGCGFGTFTLPGGDNVEVVPSFAGMPGYLPSEGVTL
jgi:hypothetical protein